MENLAASDCFTRNSSLHLALSRLTFARWKANLHRRPHEYSEEFHTIHLHIEPHISDQSERMERKCPPNTNQLHYQRTLNGDRTTITTIHADWMQWWWSKRSWRCITSQIVFRFLSLFLGCCYFDSFWMSSIIIIACRIGIHSTSIRSVAPNTARIV